MYKSNSNKSSTSKSTSIERILECLNEILKASIHTNTHTHTRTQTSTVLPLSAPTQEYLYIFISLACCQLTFIANTVVPARTHAYVCICMYVYTSTQVSHCVRQCLNIVTNQPTDQLAD